MQREDYIRIITEADQYYRVTEAGEWLILPYEEENGEC